MSYHRARYCFPDEALLRIQPHSAGPLRELTALTGNASSVTIDPNRGLVVLDPHWDNLPIGPGWEWRFV